MMMFGLDIMILRGNLELKQILLPLINGMFFEDYTHKILEKITDFSELYLRILKSRRGLEETEAE